MESLRDDIFCLEKLVSRGLERMLHSFMNHENLLFNIY